MQVRLQDLHTFRGSKVGYVKGMATHCYPLRGMGKQR